MTTPLRDRFFGCIAGVHIGSAMAAPVEGWSWQKIEETYGMLDHFLPYHHYRATTDWVREPGTTEDGVERQKLMITAIMRKQDRITAEDLRATWVTDMNPQGAGVVSEPFEGPLLAMARTPIRRRSGRYCDYAGLVSFARSCHRRPDQRGRRGPRAGGHLEVGQVYLQQPRLRWAAVTGVAIAAATRPDATVNVLSVRSSTSAAPSQALRADAGGASWSALELTGGRRTSATRQRFDSMYAGFGIPYAGLRQQVDKAVCIFRMVRGDLKVQGEHGRDTDCDRGGASPARFGNAGLPEVGQAGRPRREHQPLYEHA